MTHDLAWTSPQPFWNGTPAALSAPQILRFANDEFVNELLATLENAPATLPSYAVGEETWRGPGAGPKANPRLWLQREPRRFLGVRRKAQPRALAKATAAAPAPATTSLKLYQPAHQRHYLVCGALVCKTPGLPDRQIDPARHKTSFVIRRLFPKVPVPADQALPDPAARSLWDEYAFELAGKDGRWRRVGAADDERAVAVVLPAEDRLALSPARFTDDARQPRRMYLGSVPVGRREAYQGAATEAASAAGASAIADPRVVLFYTQVLGPWKALVNRVMENTLPPESLAVAYGQPTGTDNVLARARPSWVFEKIEDDVGNVRGFTRERPDAEALRNARSGLQTSSWYLLLDLYTFLEKYLDDEVLKPLLSGVAPNGVSLPLYKALHGAATPPALYNTGQSEPYRGEPGESLLPYPAANIERTLPAALRKIADFRATLESQQRSFELPEANNAELREDWPDFLFLFADPWFGVLAPPIPDNFAPPAGDYLAEKVQALLDTLAPLVAAALPALGADERPPEPTLASMMPADMREAWYVIRMVYERPDCAPFHGSVISAATRPFQLAGFFDPDAPARPIRIGLPVDISPAGLRKFDKNTVFMMSDMLCGQVDRMKGIGLGDLVLSVLPWPFHKDLNVPEKGPCTSGGGSLGVMCSLSIPIITICALLLLMIIVTLLDLIFRWIPYFVLCFPLPGFKGKKD
jgi:hypothetical protein